MANKLELTWYGKDKPIVVEPRILIEDASRSNCSADPDTENMLIHGDNLLALKALESKYAGQVKCIYIDPPYNTGSAFEHYDDNLEHSTWLNLMRPRLEILWKLLSDEGSIWISIDDNEEAYLKVLCDELFGRFHFVSNIAWQRTYSTRNDAKGIVNEVEHILVYAKAESWQPKRLPRTAEMDKKYKNPDGDAGLWRPDNAYAPGASTHQGMVYAIQHPFTGEMLYPSNGRCWTFGQDQMLEIMQGWCPYELKEIDDAEKRAEICGVATSEVRAGVKAIVLALPLEESKKFAKEVLKKGPWPRFFFSKNGMGGIARKTYLSAVGDVPPTNLFEYKDVGHTDEAKKEILKLFGNSPFATPKPERLIERVLTLASEPGDLVLDSFLGSGTTAAVAHKMGRRYIGIEMGDHAYTHCKVRLDKVISGEDKGGVTKSAGWIGGGGYRFYELAPSLINEDPFGEAVINPAYDADMLAAAMALHEGFTYQPDSSLFWKQSVGNESSYLFVTTRHLNSAFLDSIRDTMQDGEYLIIACRSFDAGLEKAYGNITIKKIPQMLLDRCEFGKTDYALNIVHPPVYEDEEEYLDE